MFRRNMRSFDTYADSVARFCLVQLGMSVDEVDKVNEQFFNRLEREYLGSYSEALERLINGASKDMRTQECIISSLAAVAATQVGDISEEQREFMHGFRELLDMNPLSSSKPYNEESIWQWLWITLLDNMQNLADFRLAKARFSVALPRQHRLPFLSVRRGAF